MTLIYQYKGKKYTIEQLIAQFSNFKKIWDDCLIEEYKFWGKITLDDLIVETSEAFEESISEIEYIDTDSKNFDYNILFDKLRREMV